GVRLDEGVQPFRFGKSVWITETGQRWSTAGQTLASQQRYYLRALADADDRRDWVRNLFFYELVGSDLFNVTADGSYDHGFPAFRSFEHWIKLGRGTAFELAGIPAQDPSVGAIDSTQCSVAIASGEQDASAPVAQYGALIHIGPLLTSTRGSHYNGVVL